MIGIGGEEINSLALHTVHFSASWVGGLGRSYRGHTGCAKY